MAAANPEALAAAFSDALNNGDADALGALFAPDAVFVNIAGRRMLGRDGIIDGHRWALAGPLKGSTVTLEDLAVVAVRDDLAIVHVVGERAPGPDWWAAVGPDGPGLHRRAQRRRMGRRRGDQHPDRRAPDRWLGRP